MNGRYLLVEIDDETEASTLKAGLAMFKTATLVGEFLRTDDPCQCTVTYDVNGVSDPPQMTVKQLGWRLCLGCNKPRPNQGWLQNQVKLESLAATFKTEVTNPAGQRHKVGFYVSYLPAYPVLLGRFKNG